MPLSPEYYQLIKSIDNQATHILDHGGKDEDLLKFLAGFMEDLRPVIQTAEPGELDDVCAKHPGFHQCMMLINNLVHGIAAGVIEVPPSDVLRQQNSRKPQHKYSVTEEMTKRYDEIRKILREISPKFMSGMSRDVVHRSASRLGISEGNSILLNTENESDAFFDYCFYQYRHNGINPAQKSFQAFASHYTDDKLSAFEAAANGYFAYLQVLEPTGDAGVIVFDLARNTEHLMLDYGLNKVAKRPEHYTLVTHVIKLPEFVMTTGASIPVNIDKRPGRKVQDRFEKYLKAIEKTPATVAEERQYITDLYKICIHEDIVAEVPSPSLPFGREAMKGRIVGSDMSH